MNSTANSTAYRFTNNYKTQSVTEIAFVAKSLSQCVVRFTLSHDVNSLPWYAIKIRSRSEPTIAQVLTQKGFEIFLPTYKQPRRYSDRIRTTNAPLFPGYLFSRFDINERLPLLTTPGVEYIVGPEKIPEPVPDPEIHALQTIMRSGAAAKPWPYLRQGSRVRVETGSMAGIEGILLAEKGIDRLVLSVTLLQRSVSVEIDRTWIRPL